MTQTICILTDGDNISAGYGADILKAAASEGEILISRVYSDAGKPTGWAAKPGFRLIHSASGKNSADILIAIDAMELRLTREIDTFILASSDGDFCHLATRLREYGARVIGMGESKAPETYRLACSKFILLKKPEAKVAPPPKSPTPQKKASPPPQSPLSVADQQIHAIFQSEGSSPEGLLLATIAVRMHQIYDLKISTLPEKNWRNYFSARPDLYRLGPKGANCRVSLQPPSKSPALPAHSAG